MSNVGFGGPGGFGGGSGPRGGGGGPAAGPSRGPGGGAVARGAGAQPGSASSSLVAVDERSFEAEVLRSELPVLIAFTSDRVNANPKFLADLEACAAETSGAAKVVTIDAARSPFLAKQLRIQSVPTFLIFAEGRIADMQVGLLTKKQLLTMLDPVLPRPMGAMKAAEVAQLLKQGAVVAVDTRDAAAFARAHLPGAIHMPLEGLADRIAELYMLSGPPVLYCRSGEKTMELARSLIEQNVELGYLEGGLLSWESESLPIERG